ncbi:hypothetical protein EMCG_04436 [[Emmonsia] crescens]|uniref:Uncharacterized protein n=1 Tax=[Emmonsia] crescens TaxID=73230 RepID=A0A0G2J7D9_9EURO|nr:hypothetical protein EMCG_04436 [Emmonsia crescens UAMH 3008]
MQFNGKFMALALLLAPLASAAPTENTLPAKLPATLPATLPPAVPESVDTISSQYGNFQPVAGIEKMEMLSPLA